MATNSQDNDSQKVKVITGKLIDKADMAIRPIISVFDSSQSRAVNTKRFDQFTVKLIESCAGFLGISLADNDNYKIFTKKSLMDRVYYGLKALMPAKCGECSADYVIDHEPDVAPFFNCFRCFKGSHDCERNRLLHETLSQLDTPSGFVWLCDKCHGAVDPIEPRKQRSRHTSGADNQSSSSSGAFPDLANSAVMSSTQKPNNQVSFSDELIPPEKVTPSLPELKNVCQKFLNWNCPHGISGKKVIGGKCCPYTHPRVCNQYRMSGFTGKNGCKKGSQCSFFHPDVCKTALEKGTCSKKDCKKFHPRSTRKKIKDSTESTSNTRNSKQKAPKQNTTVSPPSNTSDFLELRSLVTGMAAKLEVLERKIEQCAPSPACHPVSRTAGQMIYPAHPMMPLGVPRLPQHPNLFSHPSYF